MKLFFSYSHKDEPIRNELETHLSTLKRNGLIEAWHDRRIPAGGEFARSIDDNLEAADIILLLISPHFIESDYCYEIEMIRAMEKHESGEAKVIPVIVEHCQWHDCPFGKLNALPTDGKPITKYPNPHEALSEIAGEISKLAKKSGAATTSALTKPSPATAFQTVRSSNLRVTKRFTEKDRDDFLEETFVYISKFFEGTLSELSERNTEIETKFKSIDATKFEAKIFRDGKQLSQCVIWLASTHGQGIRYSSSTERSGNSWNESLAVCDDSQSLFLKPMNMSFTHTNRQSDGNMSKHGAAEYFWAMIIEPLQRTY